MAANLTTDFSDAFMSMNTFCKGRWTGQWGASNAPLSGNVTSNIDNIQLGPLLSSETNSSSTALQTLTEDQRQQQGLEQDIIDSQQYDSAQEMSLLQLLVHTRVIFYK